MIFTEGVNVYGFGNSDLGLGQNMRAIVNALKLKNIPHNTKTFNPNPTKKVKDYLKVNNQENYNINLVLMNPNFTYKSYVKNFDRKYNIGLWAWELEELPETWKKCADDFDEIWTISEFCKMSFEKNLPNKKIRVLDIPGEFKVKLNKQESKEKMGFQRKFVILYTFDANSCLERKNPVGVIEAFTKSLSKYPECLLVLKTHNLSPSQKIVLNKSIKNTKVLIINETWEPEQVETLFNSADIYISLHRSEGSGLTIMESIMLEIPTICTSWSGNMDFCLEGKCGLVKYEMIDVSLKSFYLDMFKRGKEERPRWANPSIDDAAEKLDLIYNNYEHYCQLIKVNKKYIEEKYNTFKLSEDINKYLLDITTVIKD